MSEKRGGTEPIDPGRDRSRLWVQGAGGSAIRQPLTAGSRGCSIRVFGEGKLEIPVQQDRTGIAPENRTTASPLFLYDRDLPLGKGIGRNREQCNDKQGPLHR